MNQKGIKDEAIDRMIERASLSSKIIYNTKLSIFLLIIEVLLATIVVSINNIVIQSILVGVQAVASGYIIYKTIQSYKINKKLK